MDFSFTDLVKLGLAMPVIGVLIWLLVDERKQRTKNDESWAVRYTAVLATISVMQDRRNDEREKNFQAMAAVAESLNKLSYAIDRSDDVTDEHKRDVAALCVQVKVMCDRFDRVTR